MGKQASSNREEEEEEEEKQQQRVMGNTIPFWNVSRCLAMPVMAG